MSQVLEFFYVIGAIAVGVFIGSVVLRTFACIIDEIDSYMK